MKTALRIRRSENFSDWYHEVIREADMAEHSDVRGCMVIKPHGYAIWEKMQKRLDDLFKETGHVNAYFPLFIPLELLAEGRASMPRASPRRCAVVTHHRLSAKNGKLVPDRAKLEEPLIIRPTSETIIWSAMASAGSRAIAICRCSSISGPMSCAGKCARDCSCAPASSSGRKATPPTPRGGGGRGDPRRCWRSIARFVEDDMRHPGDSGREDAA